MWTQYSEKPHALWLHYIDRMYPAEMQAVKVTDGTLTVEAAGCFVSALVVFPAAKKAEFDKWAEALRTRRIAQFEQGLQDAIRKSAKKDEKPWAPVRPEPKPGDGDAVLYVPRDPVALDPWTGPSDEERKATKIVAAGAPGQKVVMVLAVTPGADLGKSALELADLAGPGTIPAARIQGYYRNYRFNGKDYGQAEGSMTKFMPEMGLLPTLSLELEKGVTFSWWLRLDVPADAKAGAYKATFTLKCEGGKSFPVPVELEVYPFKLEPVVPVSYGFWGTVGTIPEFLPDAVKKQITRDRLASMVDLGLTATCVDVFKVKALKPPASVELDGDLEFLQMVKESGMGRHPEQAQLVPNIMASMGRRSRCACRAGARPSGRTPAWNSSARGSRATSRMPRQYREAFLKAGLPVAINAVDEPREYRINSWNRNFVDTLRYCDLLHEVGGIRVCCNPMADTTHGKDYTPLIGHVDILSTHAWDKSAKLMRGTLEAKKTLWLFNCGRDRYSYGFYNWRWKSRGRWEWQFMEAGDGAVGGYPGREWYNPFTEQHSCTNCAPHAAVKGGLLYQAHFFHLSEGITDAAYLYTLEETLKTARGPKADEARAYLAALERAMPEFPQIKGLASAADGPKVGMGIEDDARLKVDEWRRAVAGFLKELRVQR